MWKLAKDNHMSLDLRNTAWSAENQETKQHWRLKGNLWSRRTLKLFLAFLELQKKKKSQPQDEVRKWLNSLLPAPDMGGGIQAHSVGGYCTNSSSQHSSICQLLSLKKKKEKKHNPPTKKTQHKKTNRNFGDAEYEDSYKGGKCCDT